MFGRVFSLIVPLDTKLFLTLNGLPHPLPINLFFLFVAGITSFSLFWLGLGFLLRNKKGFSGIFTLTVLFSLFGYLFVEFILKAFFARLRPSLFFDSTITFGPSVAEFFNTYSFPSGHAFSAFGFLTIFSFYNKRFFWPLFLFASLVSFSRIYLGKHYPFDVFFGAILGVMAGFVFYKIYVFGGKNEKGIKIN